MRIGLVRNSGVPFPPLWCIPSLQLILFSAKEGRRTRLFVEYVIRDRIGPLLAVASLVSLA